PAQAVALLVGVEARAVGEVLGGRGLHERARGAVGADRDLLLDERDVAPGVRPEGARVVVRLAGPRLDRARDVVPLLAGDLARLAADAQRGVGEEAHA